MSMQKPLDVNQVKKNEKERKEMRAKYTVGIVAPNGAMHEVFCPPPDDGGDEGPKTGDSLCRWVNGEPQVPKRYKDAGYVLYADLAKEDGEPEKAERWQQAIGKRILGTPLRGDISGLYSKSVLERRAHSEAGSGKSGGKAFNVDTGELVDDPKAKKERLAGLLAEVGVKPPEGETDTEKPKAKTSKAPAKAGGKAAS